MEAGALGAEIVIGGNRRLNEPASKSSVHDTSQDAENQHLWL